MKKFVIGIDISKKSTDWCVMEGRQVLEQTKVDNSVDELAKALRRMAKKHVMEHGEMMVCAEYTGKYIYPLTVACHNPPFCPWRLSGQNRRPTGKEDCGY